MSSTFFFLAMLGLSVHELELSPAVASRGCSLVAVCGLLTAVASLVAEHRLQAMQASVAAAHGLKTCGTQALEHGLNTCGARA